MALCGQCGSHHRPSETACPLTGLPLSTPGPCGTRIDRYEILQLLGRGGFGAVYRARHALLKIDVAVKLLAADSLTPEGVRELAREARATAAIRHDNVVTVLDAGVSEAGQAFLVMELLEGQTLGQLLAVEGRLLLEPSDGITLQILDGLAAAHARGVVHRDIKPANVFLAAGDRVKLLDFGVSKVLFTASLHGGTLPGASLGTPGYMAPEQAGRAALADGRADLYATAVLLQEMLTGARPEPGSRPHLDAPAPVAAVIERGLAADPDARWQTAGELARALRSALTGDFTAIADELTRTVQSGAPSTMPAPRGLGSTWRVALLLLAAAAVGSVLMLAALALR